MRLRHGTPFIYDDDTDDIAGLRDPDGSELYLVPRLGVFFAANNQTDGAGAVPMVFTTQALSRGVTLADDSKIYVDRDGIYEFQLSTHIHNADSQAHTFELWGSVNGVGIENSRFIYSVPSSHGGTPGALIPSQNFWLALRAGAYVQILWEADDAAVTIAYHAAEAGKPVSPSLLLTVKEIAPLKP